MISLKLDTNAVLSLFPEGSETRLQLQAAIIKNVVNSVVGKKVDEQVENNIIHHVNAMMPGSVQIEQTVAAEFKKYVERRYGYSNLMDTNIAGIREMKAAIVERLKLECRDIIDDIQRESIEHASERIKEDEKLLIARVSTTLETVVRKEIMRQVNTQFPEIINDAIKERLFPEGKS